MKIDSINSPVATNAIHVETTATIQKESIREISDLMKAIRSQNKQSDSTLSSFKGYNLSHSHF